MAEQSPAPADGEVNGGMPHFVKVTAGTIESWWAPDCLDYGPGDFAAGAMHFASAIECARRMAGGSPCLIANIIGSMMSRNIDPVTHGFLDALARKAMVGRLAAPIPAEMLQSAVETSEGALSVESVRAGEADAAEMLEISRLAQAPEYITDLLFDLVRNNPGAGGAGAIWTICATAMAGSNN